MTNENWSIMVERIKNGFSEVSEEVLPLLDQSGREIERGALHVLEFTHLNGQRMRLERSSRPRILNQHQSYSGRAGTAAAISYDVSDSEFTDTVVLLSEDDYGEWQKISLSDLV